MTAIKAGYIAIQRRNTGFAKLKEVAGYGDPSVSIKSSPNPDMDTSTWQNGATMTGGDVGGTLGQDLAVGGALDLLVEEMADKLNILDA